MASDADATDAEEGTPEGYEALLEEYGRIANLGQAEQMLSWDQQVTMPEGGTPARSQQLSTLSSVSHELLVDDGVREALDSLDGTDLSPRRAAAVREVRREHERADSVPNDLVQEISATASEALPTWEGAKADDDFEAFAPTLEKLVDLKRDYARHVDDSTDPYEVLFEEYEPHLGLDTAERVLGRLRDRLVPLVDAVGDSDVTAPEVFAGTYPEADQEALVRAALDDLGYPWERGRLDSAAHPFSTGNQFDARVTTRYDESDPLDALTSTVHEFGHALYTLGLPDDAYATPLGEHRDLTVHESQSRFWENQVARSAAFWEHFLPTVAEHLGVETTPEAAYRRANRVYDDNLVRVEADELTYHMHVVLRFEIERDLVHENITVGEVPQVWNEKMEAYLGVRPETDTEGCLQDIHWAHGSFGYFPTYSLGSVLAAQVDAAMRAEIAVDERVRAGEFEPLREWLRERVHRHGKRYTTDDLVREATGEAYTADHFLDYAEEKYGELYDL